MSRNTKTKLLRIAATVEANRALTVDEITLLCTFEQQKKTAKGIEFLKQTVVPLSLALGFFFSVFPQFFDRLAAMLPGWTNMSPPILAGVDYLWNIIGEGVGKANILYHIPNIVLYAFGILGIKRLFDAIDKKTWLDRVLAAQSTVRNHIINGTMPMTLAPGHSILFVGNGDFIGMQFVLNHPADYAMTVSQRKPAYADVWNYYNPDTTYIDLKDVLVRSDGQHAGEYVFFPVKDDQIFLPSPHSYDVSPHKLDILCQNIRTIEKDLGWDTKRIIIIGDTYHKSYVQSEDHNGLIKDSGDTISLESISKKYPHVTLIDPTEIVLRRILKIAANRKIVFRATHEGLTEYKGRFYDRLEKLGYRHTHHEKGILTIGYDIFEDQTEQQTLSRKLDDYYPVVLSKNVRDALMRNGYKEQEFIYVPELVLQTLTESAAQQ